MQLGISAYILKIERVQVLIEPKLGSQLRRMSYMLFLEPAVWTRPDHTP